MTQPDNQTAIDFKSVARRITTIRGSKSQKDFAEELEFNPTYLSQIERGDTKPSLAFLMSLTGKYPFTIDWVLTGRNGSQRLVKSQMRAVDLFKKALRRMIAELDKING